MSVSEKHRTLTVIARNGLCNRLKLVLSGQAVAETTAREFHVFWARTRGCNCPLNQLFQNEWQSAAAAEIETAPILDLSNSPARAFPDLLAADDIRLTVQHHDWLVNPARYPEHGALQRRCAELLDELAPIPEIQMRAEIFRKEFFREQMIGVHLRRGDFAHVRPDVVANCDAAMQIVDDWLNDEPMAGIFLSTDDGAPSPFSHKPIASENIAARFTKRYGGRVVATHPRSLDRSTPDAIQDALVDLLLLRKTNFFVGTVGSSFSELAFFGRSIPARLTGKPTDAYQHFEQVLKWTRVHSFFDTIIQREFGAQHPYTLLWYRYKNRMRARLRGLKSTSPRRRS